MWSGSDPVQGRARILVSILVLEWTTGCSAVGPETPNQDQPDREDTAKQAQAAACRALVEAAPSEWPAYWNEVHKGGPVMTPLLIQAIRENRAGPGTQAAVHLIGCLGGDGARTFLEALLSDGSPLSTEAALALGRLADPASLEPLRKTVRAKDEPVATRVAAAATLIKTGHGRDVVDFVEAIFLAAAPGSEASTREHGLRSTKIRWAHERFMLIEAIRNRHGKTFGLDEDSSWTAMKSAAAAYRAFVEKG